jgi:hypothetical protein
VSFPHLVLARIHAHVDPYDRGSRYEDPLQAALERAQLGRVTGGGSQFGEEGEIEFADVELELVDTRGPTLDLVTRVLEEAGAPQGSQLLQGDEVLREFGVQQCLAVYLDGITLPDDVYEALDIDQVIVDLGEAAGPDSYRGFWQGPAETALYFYGPDAEALFARVEPLLRELPVGQNARVVVRHGATALHPRTVRLPRR